MEESNIIGIDLAKNIFSICVMNSRGRVLKRLNRVSRANLIAKVVGECGAGVIAMEACGGAHYFSRTFESLGYETRIIAAQFVKPFVKSNKNDAIDAEAICEAASRPCMRFVGTKSEYQQDIQAVHRVRERLVKSRTALANEIRGLFLEYGIVIPKGIRNLRNQLPEILEAEKSKHSVLWVELLTELYQELQALDDRIDCSDQRMQEIVKSNDICQRLTQVPGVGNLIATAIYAAVGNGEQFNKGREFAAWLGLTPKQYSTGGKERLGGISKRGNKYLRKSLIQGCRSRAIAAERKRNHSDPLKRNLNKTELWLFALAERSNGNKAVIALANKTARNIWHVLRGKDFKQPEQLLLQAA